MWCRTILLNYRILNAEISVHKPDKWAINLNMRMLTTINGPCKLEVACFPRVVFLLLDSAFAGRCAHISTPNESGENGCTDKMSLWYIRTMITEKLSCEHNCPSTMSWKRQSRTRTNLFGGIYSKMVASLSEAIRNTIPSTLLTYRQLLLHQAWHVDNVFNTLWYAPKDISFWKIICTCFEQQETESMPRRDNLLGLNVLWGPQTSKRPLQHLLKWGEHSRICILSVPNISHIPHIHTNIPEVSPNHSTTCL